MLCCRMSGGFLDRLLRCLEEEAVKTSEVSKLLTIMGHGHLSILSCSREQGLAGNRKSCTMHSFFFLFFFSGKRRKSEQASDSAKQGHFSVLTV